MRYGKNVRSALVTITQFGLDMLVPICLCSAAGYLLDSRLGTSWIFIVMFFVGAIAGAGNVYRYARKLYSDESGDDRNRDHAANRPEDSGDKEDSSEDNDEN